ncbi:unnamed protein product [Hymenolepis diminuta]|uniref:C-SKI_SMAD_bind domain-containing protein n=1 Tax=Hymenolepis diminuta TaxID=6216 RepID=A0A0R3SIW8_HYMDI|nr:unnamed protein product [Hymenolepis diminuta]
MTQAASFSDKTNPMNPLIPRILRRQMEGTATSSSSAFPSPSSGVNFLPDSVRLPAEIEASYLNLLALNSHILSPFARQLLLGSRNLPNLNPKRPLVPLQPSQSSRTISTFPSHSTGSFPSSSSVPPQPLTSTFSLPRPHEIEETGELVYSIVEGEKVMGFNVWGEVRLCLPHLLRFVLYDVDIDEIGQALSKLRIACTKCSHRQLAMLHGCNALPAEVTSCGLIRKSDAERMLKFLRSSRERPTLADAEIRPPESAEGLKTAKEEASLGNYIDVRHDCFGTEKGRIYPHLYASANSPCIACRTCNKLFSPQDFVGHTHSVNESDSCCHWGFDSTNWRSYLQLDIDPSTRHKKAKRDNSESEEEENPDVRTYRALRDFKVKFLKPLHLPKEIKKMVPKSGDCKLDVKKQDPTSLSVDVQPLDCSTNKPSPIPQDILSTVLKDPTSQMIPDDNRLEVRLRPNLKIRRLWAPHQGRLRIPNPPKLISNCPRGPKPRNLSSGPPILLDPSCIVTKDSAQLYGRDFIPNVCLKPISPTESSNGQSQQLHLSRSLPSVPSNEDLVSVAEKRLSEADLYPDLKTIGPYGGGHRSRPTIRIPQSLGIDFNLFPRSGNNGNNQGLNSIDSSPARARHSSSAHDTVAGSLSNPLDLHKRCATEEVLRCPSVDSAPVSGFRGQLSRTTSDPELIFTARSGLKRERTGSWSLTPPSSSISPSRRRHLLETTSIGINAAPSREHTIKSSENRRPAQLSTEPVSSSSFLRHFLPPSTQSQTNWGSSTPSQSSQTTPEMLINLSTDANPRIPNIASHWTSMLERIEQFCNSVSPGEESAKRRFDMERQKLMVDLNVLREKNLSDLSMVMKDNKKLWKVSGVARNECVCALVCQGLSVTPHQVSNATRNLLTDALPLTGTSPTLTPNTLAPPCGVIPGVTDVDQISRMINLLQGFKPAAKPIPSENFRQSAPMETLDYQPHHHQSSSERSSLPFWPISSATANYRSATTPDMSITAIRPGGGLLSSTTNGVESSLLYTSNNTSSGDSILPSKRQRLFRHSYSANSHLNP